MWSVHAGGHYYKRYWKIDKWIHILFYQTDRETLTRRIREILHQCYKFGFEVGFFYLFWLYAQPCLPKWTVASWQKFKNDWRKYFQFHKELDRLITGRSCISKHKKKKKYEHVNMYNNIEQTNTNQQARAVRWRWKRALSSSLCSGWGGFIMTFKTRPRKWKWSSIYFFKHIYLQVCSEMVRTRQGLQTRLGYKGFYFVTVGIKRSCRDTNNSIY